MGEPTSSVFETRSHQMFPTLAPAEVERLRRLGAPHADQSGERLVATGEISPGVFVVRAGDGGVAAAVGEGAQVVAALHAFLPDTIGEAAAIGTHRR